MDLLTELSTVIAQNNSNNLYIKNENFIDMLQPIYSDYCRYILSLSKNKELAEDVVQNSLLLAYENIDKLRDKSKFKAWLFSIGKREFIKAIKDNSITLDLLVEELEFKGPTPENAFLISENVVEIIVVINELSTEDRLIFLLRELGELQFKQIARVLDMNNTTVRTRYKRIRNKIIQAHTNE